MRGKYLLPITRHILLFLKSRYPESFTLDELVMELAMLPEALAHRLASLVKHKHVVRTEDAPPKYKALTAGDAHKFVDNPLAPCR